MQAPKLPQAEQAQVDQRKIIDYLLAPDHPEGHGKAEFFTRFGFSAADWTVFAKALVEHASVNPVASVARTKFGTKYRVDGPLSCPDGRQPIVRTVWIIDNDATTARLVTAFPL